jgi:predicted enzyme related to lactoylglutathione lyase
MPIKSTRDIIIRTDAWDEAIKFYGTVLGFPITHSSESIVGFETGAFCLYVEKGEAHGPVFEYLVADVQATKRKLVEGGCTVTEENASVPRCYLRDSFGMIFNIGKSNG